jgi:hypothetical protein
LARYKLRLCGSVSQLVSSRIFVAEVFFWHYPSLYIELHNTTYSVWYNLCQTEYIALFM